MADISAIAEDYLKAIWCASEWGGVGATTKNLAERFGVAPATASDTVRRLAAHGLLHHDPYKEITLTTQGEQHAIDPIPARDGTIDYPPDTVRLTEARPGQYTVSRISDSDSDRLVFFLRNGLVPGLPLTVTAQDSHAQTVLVGLADGAQLTLAHPTTDAVILVPTQKIGPRAPVSRVEPDDESIVSAGRECMVRMKGERRNG